MSESERAMTCAVEMEVHASLSTATRAKAEAIDAHFPAYDELLAALKLFRSAIEVLGDGPDDSDQAMAHGMLVQANELAMAAISKAEGRQP